MLAFYDEIQWLSLFTVDEGRSFFTVLSILFMASHMLIRHRNHKKRLPKSLYHYTTFSRLLAIQESGYIKGGHHGIVFTTATRRFRNRGTGRSEILGKKSESRSQARIVFRGNALKLFRNPASKLISLFTGSAILADLNDEYVTRQRGSLRLLGCRMFGKTLLVTDAEFAPPPATERIYMRVNGLLLQGIKTILSSLHCMTFFFWADYFITLTWFRLNWISIFILFVVVVLVSLLLAECIYLIFRNRIGLE